MKRVLFGMALAAAIAGGVTATVRAQQGRAETALRAAVETETVKGDLKGAIEQYKKLVEQHKDNRAVAAQALLRMADCYERLGSQQARRIYERLAADYADQTSAAATARTRLGRAASGLQARGDRAVWRGLDVDLFGTVSPDGNYLSYVDWVKTGNLMLRDIAGGVSRALTGNSTYGEFGEASYSAISRDGKQIAYEWMTWVSQDARHELRVANLAATGLLAPRTVRQDPEQASIRPLDWSPDGKSIAVLIERADRSSQLGIVSLHDGSLRGLKSINWRGLEKAVFSPDGRYLAFDLATGEVDRKRHIFLISTDATREIALVTHDSQNNLMGWSPDGRLLFASDRSGDLALWALPIADGTAPGPARIVKTDLASSYSLGLTSGGTLYVWKRSGSIFVGVADIDFAAGSLAFKLAHQRFVASGGRPSWSPDGKHLLYISCGETGGGPCTLNMLATETGSVVAVPSALGYIRSSPRLSPNGRLILADGTDLKGRRGIYLIDTVKQQTSLLLAFDPADPIVLPSWSDDGSSLRYVADRGGARTIVERTIGSTVEREVLKAPAECNANVQLSPDKRLVACARRAKGRLSLVVAPKAGGAGKAVFDADQAEMGTWTWLPDSQGLVVLKSRAKVGSAWVVPLDAAPRQLNIDVSNWVPGGAMQLHPDGRRIAFVAAAGEPGAEVWALENFLEPASSGTASTRKPTR